MYDIGWNYKYLNFVKQIVDGVEVELALQPVKNLSLTANYTLITGDEQTQSRKTVKDTTYSYLLRRPKNNFNINIGYQFTKGVFASISGKSVSSRHDVGGLRRARRAAGDRPPGFRLDRKSVV